VCYIGIGCVRNPLAVPILAIDEPTGEALPILGQGKQDWPKGAVLKPGPTQNLTVNPPLYAAITWLVGSQDILALLLQQHSRFTVPPVGIPTAGPAVCNLSRQVAGTES
jgi:hypothetical protein